MFDSQLGRRLPLRILVADDISVNQKLIVSLLDRLGYHADVAATGREVLAALGQRDYDLILMDVHMPDMDGLEATRQIHRQYADPRRPRVVALTADDQAEDRDQCRDAGMDDYLTKPVMVQELEDLLVRWGEWRQTRTAGLPMNP